MSEPQLIFTGPSPKGAHRLETFISCPRKFALTYRTGLGGTEGSKHKEAAVAGKDDALIVGSLLHLGLAHHYARLKEVQQGGNPDYYYKPLDAINHMAELMKWNSHGYLDNVNSTFEAYLYHFRNEKLKIVAVEELLTANINGHDYSGRTDLMVEDSNGMVWIWDHKSCARYTKEKHEEYSLSIQMNGYKMLGRAAFGDRFAGIRLNYLQHGDTKRFIRQDAESTPGMEASFPDLVTHVESQIATLTREKPDVMTWPKQPSYMTCMGRYKGSTCPFIENCKWRA